MTRKPQNLTEYKERDSEREREREREGERERKFPIFAYK